MYYVRDGAELLAVVEGSSVRHWNITRPGGPAVGRHEPGGSRRYYVTDLLGSIRAVLDGSGSVDAVRNYYPFGLPLEGRYDRSSPATQEDFTGHVKDTETDLHYAGARYYSGAFGRWLRPDPVLGTNPKELLEENRPLLTMTSYNYAFDQPTALSDPTGKFPCGGVCVGAGIVIGASTVAGALGGAATSAGIQLVENGSVDAGRVGTAGLKGGAVGLGVSVGALLGAGTAVGASVAGVLGGGTAGGGSEIVEAIIRGESPADTRVDVALGTLAGGFGAFVGGKAGSKLLARSMSPRARAGLVDLLAKNLTKFKNTRKALKVTLEKSVGAPAAKRIIGSLFGGSSKQSLEEVLNRGVEADFSGSDSGSFGCTPVRKSCQ